MNARLRRLRWLIGLCLWMLALCLRPSLALAEELGLQGDGLSQDREVLEESQQASLTAHVSASGINRHGNVSLDVSCDALKDAFALGDVVTVAFLDKSVDVPFCKDYSDVDSGEAALFARPGKDYGLLAVNMGDFATAFSLATKTETGDTFSWAFPEGVQDPVELTITLKEAGGYYDQYVMHQLSYTDNRDDYPNLSDEQFANFREVTTTGMGSGILYRSASPVNGKRNRNSYADAAIAKAGVNRIVNLVDTEADLVAFEGYDQTYYATAKHVALGMSMDVTSESNKAKLAEGLRFMAQNPGVYAIHCFEGKDRTGLVLAVLECLMGATKDEVVADYMVTYYDYYGVTPGDERYDVIANSNIVKTLKRVFGVESLDEADLAAEAEGFLTEIGLTADEISALKANLSLAKTFSVAFDMGGHGCAPQSQQVTVGECAERPSDPLALGFTFAGWYTDEARTQAFDFATPITQDTALYAKWVKVPCPQPASPVYPRAVVWSRIAPLRSSNPCMWSLARNSYLFAARSVKFLPWR